MYYILHPDIALRSWWRVPCAYYRKGSEKAKGLTQEDFDFLLRCDGNTELPEDLQALSLQMQGLIRPCEAGERLQPWQEYRSCDNRYVPMMNLMITGKCNYNCLHCFNAADNAPLNSELSMEQLDRLLDQALECGIQGFVITGGEPMLHRSFMDVIQGIYRRGMHVFELNTNGSRLNGEILDRFREIGADMLIKISFDGLGWHDWMRNRPGAEKEALRAIRLCREKGFRVKVQMNMNRRNVDAIPASLLLLDEMGIGETRVICTTPAPRWEQNAAGQSMEFPEYFDRALEIAETYMERAEQMRVNFWQFLTLDPRDQSFSMDAVSCCDGQYRDSLPRCKGIRGMIAVSARGEVYPCMQMSGWMEAKGIRFGSILEGGLQPLLQDSTYMDTVCMRVDELHRRNPRCGACRFFRYCTGGCPALGILTEGFDGALLGADLSKCIFYEKGYYARIVKTLAGCRNRSFCAELEESDAK